MKNYTVDKIRNIALLGHSGCGKTTLVEAMLFNSGRIDKMGSIQEKNTVSDFDNIEVNRGHSIYTSFIHFEHEGYKLNILDSPGLIDLFGESVATTRVADSAILVIDATSGIEVGTEKNWMLCESRKLPRIIFLNKIEKDNVDYNEILKDLKDKFGKKVAPLAIPVGKASDFSGFIDVVDFNYRKYEGGKSSDIEIPAEYIEQVKPVRNMLLESIAESSEELMEKYFNDEEFTREEVDKGLRTGIADGSIVPVLVGSTVGNIGIGSLLEVIDKYLPTPVDLHGGEYTGINPKNDEEIVRKAADNEPFSALVFKTLVDPYLGKVSIFKVNSGTLKKDDVILNSSKDVSEKIGNIYLLRGKKQKECDVIYSGEIGAVTKVESLKSGDTMCDKNNPIVYDRINYPKPCIFKAIEPKTKKDEDKLSTALSKLSEEDPTLAISRNAETHQLVIGAQGLVQIQIMLTKLKEVYKVDVDLTELKIAYRETITGKSDVQGKHKKQSGGAGQYGDVKIRFEPSSNHFEFVSEIFGGAVPKNYIPAVEKGLEESMSKGPLAGFPVMNIKATLYDGSYHAVDSSDMAFKIAASFAFKQGIKEANPVILEPVMDADILVPDDYTGDVMGEMSRRRGRITGMEPAPSQGWTIIKAHVPYREMLDFTPTLKSITGARGSFTMDFDIYEVLPKELEETVINENTAYATE